MKILHVVPTYAPAWQHGGPIRAVHGLCRALAARGHRVTVFTTAVDTAGAVPVGRATALDGVEVWYFPVRLRRLYDSPAMARALAARVAGFDVVHLHSVFLRPTALAARAAERAGVPYVVAPRGMLVADLLRRRGRCRKALWLRLVERRTLARAAGLHATSDLEAAAARDLAARLGLTLPPVFVVPNGVEVDEYRPEAPVSETVRGVLAGGPFFLFLGRLSWKKGLDRLLPALAQAPGARLAVAGNDAEGYRPKLEKLAAEKGVAERVVFTGPVDGNDKAALLHRAVATVLPSYSENFGNSALESLAAGRPVVVTPEVGLAGVVRETGAGVVVEGNPDALGRALAGLLADPAAADAMGRRGAEAAKRRFGWDAVAADMEAVYRETARGALSLAFVVERPTQFEVPFYRFAAQDPANRLKVIYTDPRCGAPVFDPELGREVAWGFDLLGGYEHAVLPRGEGAAWLRRELHGCDLAIVNGYTQRAYLAATAAARREGIATGLRLDSVLWEGPPPRRNWPKRLLFAAFLKRRYELFFGVGSLTAEYLRACGVPAARIALFPYAVDVAGFRERSALAAEERAAVRARLGVPADDTLLLAVTKLNEREAPWDLLRALGARGREDGRWLAVAGDGPARPALEAFARESGLARVRFLGYVPYPELPGLYAASDLFLHPVREERWGVSVAEAMACGLPVVASSRVGAARDLVTPGRNGGVYPAGDAAALERAIEAALALPVEAVRAWNREVLARWDYAATWRGLLAAAGRLGGKR